MKSLLATALAVLALVLQSILHPAASQAGTVRGITYTVDTTANGDQVTSILGPLGLKVTYAGARGRIDVLARATRPAVQAKWVILSHPKAVPGDYYLFDSTGFVHVHPATKHFTRYRLAAASFNFEGRRDGWPFFRYDPFQLDTLADGARANAAARDDFTIYWHAELMRDTSCTGMSFGNCLVRELARGRTDVIDAPAEEAGVVRWFGPTRGLAQIGGLASLVGQPVRLTAIAQWRAVRGDSVTTLATIRFLSGLREVALLPSALTLPHGYRESPPSTRR